MKNLLAILFSLVSILVFAQPSVYSPKIFTTKTDNLNGKVKKVTEITYETDSTKSFNDTIIFNYNQTGYRTLYENKYYSIINLNGSPQLDKYTYKYDKHYNLTEESSFYNENILRQTDEWKYDEKNRIIEHIILDDEDKKERFREKMKYNEEGKLLKTKIFRYQKKEPDAITEFEYKNGNAVLSRYKYRNCYGDCEGEKIYSTSIVKSEYDNSGNEIKSEEYNDLGEITRVTIKKYNDKNQQIRREYWENDSMRYAWEWSFDTLDKVDERKQFDSDNNLITNEQWFKEGNTETKISKTYENPDSTNTEIIRWTTDNFGNEIEYSWEKDGNIISHIKTEYEYDKYNNWTESRRYDKIDETPTSHTVRRIDYYE